MYVYDEYDQQIIEDRVKQFRDQTRRYLAGELSEEEFRPLRLQNGLYVQRFAPMLRVAVPYGQLTSRQARMMAKIARDYDKGYAHISTRQNVQFNWPALEDIPDILEELATVQMHAIQTSGNCLRNVTTDQFAGVAADELIDSRPWCEIVRQWTTFHPEFAYLPRKFKIAIAVPPLNDVDVFANDLGLIAIVDATGNLSGFNVAIGGSMGASHGIAAHYPRVANVIGFVTPEQVFAIAEAAITVQRDLGDREDRKHARFKYTIDDHGSDKIVAMMQARAGFTLQAARPYHFDHNGDRFGWVEGENGLWHLTLSLPSGRIADFEDGRPLLTGLREIAKIHTGQFRMTCNQNVIIAGVPEARRAQIDALVQHYALDRENNAVTALARSAVACVALPTCALAMAEAERYLPTLLAVMEPLLVKHGLRDTPIVLRISGCPNGCSRPYLAEIALVGKAPGRYSLMLGGDHRGTRLNTLYRDNITEAQIIEALDPLLARYAAERQPDEHFGDFLHRAEVVALPPYPTHVRVVPHVSP